MPWYFFAMKAKALKPPVYHKRRKLRADKINLSQIARYALSFIAFLCLSHATVFDSFSPFALGLFVGLVYARQNILVLTPLYILAALTVDFSLYTFIYTLTPAVVLTVCYYLCYKASKTVTLITLAVCTLIGSIPYIAISCVNSAAYFEIFFTALLAVVFALVCEIGCYALVLRGLNYHLSADERICLAVMLAALSFGVYRLPLGGFNIFYILAAFASMFFIMNFSKDVALIVGIAMGAGAYLGGGNIGVASLVALWTALALPFRGLTKFSVAAAIAVVNTLIELYVDGLSFDYLELIAVLTGLILYLIIPKKIAEAAAQSMGGLSQKAASRNIVNQNRKEMSVKLGCVSSVFYSMQNMLSSSPPVQVDAYTVADSIIKTYCAKCPSYPNCTQSNLPFHIAQLVEAGMTKGRITILDTTSQLSANCKNLSALTAYTLSACETTRQKLKSANETDGCKKLLAEQFGSVASVIGELGQDMKKRVSYSLERENSIIAELGRHNIIAEEAIVYGESPHLSVTLAVRESDYDKAVLEKIVSKVLRCKMERASITDKPSGSGWKTVYLNSAPRYGVAFGMSRAAINPECGDSLSVTKLDDGKIIIGLSDGMGTGAAAKEESQSTITLIENLYKAGLKSSLILPLVNKLLCLNNFETYSTLDIGILDRDSGVLDAIKLGAVATYITDGQSVRQINSHALPMGILDTVTPSVESVKLSTSDMVIMLSDGVIDTMGEDAFLNLITYEKSFNPQTVCDRIISKCNPPKDDCSVVAFRLSNNL